MGPDDGWLCSRWIGFDWSEGANAPLGIDGGYDVVVGDGIRARAVDGRVVGAGGDPFEEVLFLVGVDSFGRYG